MKVENTSTTQKIKNRVNDIKEESQNQNNAPKEIRRGIGMSDEQKDFAKKIKQDIQNLYYKEGYSIRMIASHYNDLYSIRDKQGNIVKFLNFKFLKFSFFDFLIFKILKP